MPKHGKDQPKIIVIGLGFVGLACFAGFKSLGYEVYGIEKDKEKTREIKSLSGTWLEPGVIEALKSEKKFDEFILNDINQLPTLDDVIYLVCVGTPQDDSGKADLEILNFTINEILESYVGTNVEIAIKSTVPPGTTMQLEEKFSNLILKSKEKKISLITNPEFLREGHAFEDFIEPDRIILGSNSSSVSMLGTVYKDNFDNIFVTNTNSAEFCKYYSNCALAVMISFANEIRLLGDEIGGIDSRIVFEQFGKDRRWQSNLMKSYFWPGIGFGGYCLPKDTKALANLYPEENQINNMLQSAIDTNDKLVEHFAKLIFDKFQNHRRVVLCGSSFKVGSNDIRVSKTLELVLALQRYKMLNVALLDELAAQEIQRGLPSIELIKEPQILPTDAVVIVLKDQSYTKLASRTDKQNLLNIPLL